MERRRLLRILYLVGGRWDRSGSSDISTAGTGGVAASAWRDVRGADESQERQYIRERERESELNNRDRDRARRRIAYEAV